MTYALTPDLRVGQASKQVVGSRKSFVSHLEFASVNVNGHDFSLEFFSDLWRNLLAIHFPTPSGVFFHAVAGLARHFAFLLENG